MRRILSMLLVGTLCMGALIGCAQTAAPAASEAAPAESAAAPEAASEAASEAAPAEAEAPAFTPAKKVEVIVPNAAGGGTDIFARKVVEIINQYDFCNGTTFTVENKGGASGAIAGGYVLGQRGNDNLILFASTALWTTPLSGKADYKYTDFTPLVEMSQDVVVLAVGGGTPYNTIEEFIEDAKSEDDKISFCGSSITSEGGLLSIAFQKATGAKTKYVPYDSGGEAVIAVMGGHVTATWTNYGEIEQQIQSGDIRVLAVASGERLPELPDVPTMLELGYDVELVQERHIAAAPDMSEEAQHYWSDIFAQVYETPEFKQYLKDNALNPHFTPVDEWKEEYVHIGEIFKPLLDEAIEMGV